MVCAAAEGTPHLGHLLPVEELDTVVSRRLAVRFSITPTSTTKERSIALRAVAPLGNAHRTFERALHEATGRAFERRALQEV